MAFLRLSLSQIRTIYAASHDVKALVPQPRGRTSMQENLAYLEETMQKECEPVGEHLLSYRFRSAKERRNMLTVCKSFLFFYCLYDLACLYCLHCLTFFFVFFMLLCSSVFPSGG